MAAVGLLAFGILACVASTTFLFNALLTDKWFIIDATKYRIECREDILLQNLYPWQGSNSNDASRKSLRDDDTPYSGEGKVVNTRVLLRNDKSDKAGNTPERTPNDEPVASEADSFGFEQRPLPLMVKGLHRQKKHVSVSRKRRIIGKESNSHFLKRRNADSAISQRGKSYGDFGHKLARWNSLVRNMEYNLGGFGGRDVTYERGPLGPSGVLSNECAMKARNVTGRCEPKSPTDCRRLQFSTYTGLWRTCLSEDESPILTEIVSKGIMKRCALVQYANMKTHNLPPALKPGEIQVVFREEWKTLHLRRILTSFLCMAAPVQVFGLILMIGGWISKHGFIIYAGGLVLVMSGTFQLFAIGTSILLFDLELSRSPVELYKFPEGVTLKFGRSAHSLWLSTALAAVAGFLSALSTTILQSNGKNNKKYTNGVVTTLVPQPENGSSNEVDDVPYIPASVTTDDELLRESPSQQPKEETEYSRSGARSGSLATTLRRKEFRRQSKAFTQLNASDSYENLDVEISGGRSPTKKSRPVSPLAKIRIPQVVLSLDCDNISHADSTSSFSMRESASAHEDRMKDLLDTRCRLMRHKLPYSHSLNVPVQEYGYNAALSCQTTVNISQRLRYARHARRTAHSCDESVTKLRNILTSLSLDGDRKTRSLPRPTMHCTPLSELSATDGNVLRDHCDLFLQRHGLMAGKTDSSYAGTVNPLIRHHSEGVNPYHRSCHPIVTKWSRDNGRWTRSLDEENQRKTTPFSRDSMRTHSLAREGTLGSLQESVEINENKSFGKDNDLQLHPDETKSFATCDVSDT